MVTKPPIDELTQMAGNKYILCCAVTKRAKQLDQMQANDEISTNVKTISFAGYTVVYQTTFTLQYLWDKLIKWEKEEIYGKSIYKRK